MRLGGRMGHGQEDKGGDKSPQRSIIMEEPREEGEGVRSKLTLG